MEQKPPHPPNRAAMAAAACESWISTITEQKDTEIEDGRDLLISGREV